VRTGAKGVLKCVYRPARSKKRTFTAKSAAAAVCAALRAGFTQQEIRLELARCIECSENRRRSQAQAQAVSAIEGSNTTLLLADGALNAFEFASRLVSRVARFVPAAKGAEAPLRLMASTLGNVRGTIKIARAANDAALTALRLAA